MTDIQRCEVRPGRLVEWTLSPATVAAAAGLPEDSRPPAYIQESHIRTARSVREDGLFVPTWLGAAFDIPGRVDLDALQEALRELDAAARDAAQRLPLGRRRDAPVHARRRGRVAAPRGGRRLHRRRRPGPAPPGPFRRRGGRAAAGRTSSTRRSSGTTAPACTWPSTTATSTPTPSTASPPRSTSCTRPASRARRRERTPVGSYVDFCEIERADADRIDDTHAIVARWREFIDRCDGKLPNFPVDLGLDPEGALPTQKLMREMLVDDADAAAAFEAYCRPYGGSLVGVLAATGLIVHEIGGQPVYRTVVPFHTRAEVPVVGLRGLVRGRRPDRGPRGPGARLRRAPCRRSAPSCGPTGRWPACPLARVLRLLGTDFRPTSPDLYSIVSFVDARGIPARTLGRTRRRTG